MRTTANRGLSEPEEGGIAGDLARGFFGLVWFVIRVPIVLFLIIIEPFVSLLLAGAAVLGVITAILFETSSVAPTFPFWWQIGMSFGCLLVLALYHALIRLLS